MTRLALPIGLAIALFAAIVYIVRLQAQMTSLRDGGGTAPRTATAQPPAAAAPATPGPTRTLTDEQKQGMLEVLRGETSEVRRVWFQVDARAEPTAFQKQLEQVFRDAGWQVATEAGAGLVFKPGVSLLVAEEDWPSYAETAFNALQKAGIEVKAARGYRAYYEEQKREKPSWQGPKLEADQTYVVIVGPSPPA
ncbi:MAG TPA: hypothetical protein VKA21_02605 [Candidatus Binatia bacterium]|nr:hypothetical protein [Candidatus Binatia bacterium]